MTHHEDLARVLVHRPLRVPDGGDVLDDDDVVGVLALLGVEEVVGVDLLFVFFFFEGLDFFFLSRATRRGKKNTKTQ